MKKLSSLLLAGVLVWALAGCTNEKPTANNTQTATPNTVNQESKTATPEPKKATPEPKFTAIQAGEKVQVADYCEFTLESAKFSKKVIPSNPGTFYTYYEAKEAGTTYLDTIISIKSLLTEAKAADDFASVKLKYNNKYEYKTFSTIENQGGKDFTYTNITSIEPLKSGKLHFLAEVPEEVQNGSEPLSITITINKKDYQFNVR